MKLILLRHGEAGKNLPGGRQRLGADSANLTLKGVHKAVAAGKELTKNKIGAIYCSPMARCVQTMDEVLRLRDDNMPIYLTRLLGPKTKKESYEQLKKRIEMMVDDLKNDHEKEAVVLVISHQKPIEMMVWLIEEKKIKIENGEMVEFKI